MSGLESLADDLQYRNLALVAEAITLGYDRAPGTEVKARESIQISHAHPLDELGFDIYLAHRPVFNAPRLPESDRPGVVTFTGIQSLEAEAGVPTPEPYDRPTNFGVSTSDYPHGWAMKFDGSSTEGEWVNYATEQRTPFEEDPDAAAGFMSLVAQHHLGLEIDADSWRMPQMPYQAVRDQCFLGDYGPGLAWTDTVTADVHSAERAQHSWLFGHNNVGVSAHLSRQETHPIEGKPTRYTVQAELFADLEVGDLVVRRSVLYDSALRMSFPRGLTRTAWAPAPENGAAVQDHEWKIAAPGVVGACRDADQREVRRLMRQPTPHNLGVDTIVAELGRMFDAL